MLKIYEKICSLSGKDAYVAISEEDIKKIDENAKRILAEMGFKVMHPRMMAILEKKRYSIEGEVVRIDPLRLDELLQNVPKREGKRDIAKEGKICVGYLANQIYDAEMDRVRYPTQKDLDEATVVGLSTPEVSAVWPLFEPKDVSHRVADIQMLDVMLRRVEGSNRNEILNKESLQTMIEMCQVVAGSREEVLKRNMLIYYAFITTPLKYDFVTLDLAFEALDNGISVRFGAPMTIAGATAPVTFAGTLTLCLAEAYSGLILADATGQKWGPAMAPVTMDQSTGATQYGGPDRALLSLACGDICRYLGLGGGVGHLSSDATKPGVQAGIEKAYAAMLCILAGTAPAIGMGGLLGPGGLVGSIEQILIDAQIVSMFNRIIKGIEVSDETIALELIKKIGFEGNYLAEEHTAKHFRGELWFPGLMRRLNPSAWNEEKPDMLKEARRKVKDILASNDPRALSKEQEKELDRIVKRALE